MKKSTKVASGPKKNLGSCSVCFEQFKSSRKIVKCPFCPSKTCIICCQEFLLTVPKNPRCMSNACKKEWPLSFFVQKFSEDFRKGDYLQAKKKLLLAEQRSALPGTLPLVESKKKEQKLKKENIKLKELLKKLQDEEDKIYETILANSETIKTGIAPSKKSYVIKCPVVVKENYNEGGGLDSEEMCRGFIEKETFCCTLCKTQICEKCHLVQKDSHKCKKDDVETAKMVMAETRPCPNCSTRIFKIIGCDQMFCTQCHTAFSWNTGMIETGIIHNPHYYELQRKLGANARAAGDVPCGGLPEFRQILFFADRRDVIPNEGSGTEKLFNIHRRTAEISSYIRARSREVLNYEDIRVNYLLNKLTEAQFEEEIYERSCLIEKRREELQILSTFETAVIERFNKLIEEGVEINTRKIKREEKTEESEEETSESSEKEKTPTKRRRHRRGRVRAAVKKAPLKARVPSKMMNLPSSIKKELLSGLVKKFTREITKIISFCNEAFEENFTAMGYLDYPEIDLSKEYEYLKPLPVANNEIGPIFLQQRVRRPPIPVQ